ncbi:sensor domain-containing diguanylate cyclase [Paraglaciecola sp. L1A13]|uniref:sensor domain-containing diguanylate cyclase n=1 Tax=Paraglaciecola sp. L1A13 TaxID=2686359 RepID=UPI0018EF1E63
MLFIMAIAVGISGYFTLSDSVEEQSRLQQQSMSPAFDLITEELVKPLHTAQVIANTQTLRNLMSADTIDDSALLALVKRMSMDYNMTFFVASETSRTQYNSNGTTLALKEGEVEWYFRVKEQPLNVAAALGNRQDVHIYFDVKVFNDQGQFLGFIGVGKRLKTFLDAFDRYKDSFGYDFVFVDNKQDIVLASDPKLLANGKRILQVKQLPWFQALTPKQQALPSLNNIIVKTPDYTSLIAQIDIKVLRWKMYILTPLSSRKDASTEAFTSHTSFVVLIIFLIFVVAHLVIRFFERETAKKHQLDPLTQLHNRAHIQWRFDKIVRANQEASLIMVDADNFKKVNDTFGHNIGDKVLIKIAQLLQNELREYDAIARWGGEEFVILLPSTKLEEARIIAQRTCSMIASHPLSVDNIDMFISASFGVTHSPKPRSLERLIKVADDALYEAKHAGKSCVRVHES